EERVLFRRLAVFAGGCTLESAEAIGGAGAAGDPPLDVVEGLASLVDKGLLRPEPDSDDVPRFALLETVREDAAERLGRGGEAGAVRWRHARHFLAVAEEAEAASGTDRRSAWLRRLEADHGNLRAALEWGCVQRRRPPPRAAEAGRSGAARAG